MPGRDFHPGEVCIARQGWLISDAALSVFLSAGVLGCWGALMPVCSARAQKEASEVFFSVTKLYQSKDANLRRMVYLVIKDVCPGSDEVIIITSSLMKDMNSKTDLYRSNAIRVLCSIIDSQLLGQIERYLKQASAQSCLSFSMPHHMLCASSLCETQYHTVLHLPKHAQCPGVPSQERQRIVPCVRASACILCGLRWWIEPQCSPARCRSVRCICWAVAWERAACSCKVHRKRWQHVGEAC